MGEPLRDFVEHLVGTEKAKEEDGTRALMNFCLGRAINWAEQTDGPHLVAGREMGGGKWDFKRWTWAAKCTYGPDLARLART